MKFTHFPLCLAAIFCIVTLSGKAQSPENLPKDYLTKEFHAGRREALRKMMPGNSVMAIFAYPQQVFSKDVNYFYHPNPDLYYFSGYKETNAVLLIFKSMQRDAEGDFNELFYVQSRDPQQEQWTGKRLGVEGVKSKLGFTRVYNSEDFEKLQLDLKKFKMINDAIPQDQGNMADLYQAFQAKTGVSAVNQELLSLLTATNTFATPQNIKGAVKAYLLPKMVKEPMKSDLLMLALIKQPDSLGLLAFRKAYDEKYSGTAQFNQLTDDLRGVKTGEELALLRKSAQLSAIAHAEVMRAIKPAMSEAELEGIFRYVHKKYQAEDEGYPPIVGAGGNGCILHYEENNLTRIDNQLVLMDVGAEYHGYSADVTRTVPANGKFTAEQKAIYELVYQAQEEVFKLCKAGTPFDDLNKKAREILAAGLTKLQVIKTEPEVDQYYPHGCSHHLGLDVHDKGGNGPLKENMVITVEPGIYIPAGSACDKKWWNIGVRIEDDVIIGKTRCINLSADAPRRWDLVEKMVAESSFFDAAKFPVLKD